MLSIAHARNSVILAGKRGSRRHSTTGFSENVVVAGTSYQLKDEFYHFATGRGLKLQYINNRFNFCDEEK